MRHPEPWNPLVDWKPAKIEWIRVNISRDDLLKFTRRSNFKGLIQAVGFLAIVAMTGAWAYWSFSRQYWLMLALESSSVSDPAIRAITICTRCTRAATARKCPISQLPLRHAPARCTGTK